MSKSYSPTWRLISVIVLRPLLTLLIRNKWSGRENIPRKGGVIFAPNHLVLRGLGTDASFFQATEQSDVPDQGRRLQGQGIGPFLQKARQLEVHRGRADAGLVSRRPRSAWPRGPR